MSTRARDLVLGLLATALGAIGVGYAHAFPDSFNGAPPQAIATDPTDALEALPPIAPPQSYRVVLFVVDGLRDDYTEHLELGPWEARAARSALVAPWPSYSRSGYAVIGTGAPPTWSGVHNNGYEGAARLDHVFLQARRAGYRVAAILDNEGWWEELFPGVFEPLSQDPAQVEASLGRVFGAADPPGLTLVHLEDPDNQAHDHRADSPEHRSSLARAGALVRGLLERHDPARDTVVLIADHGHLDRGGHGGPEPLVTRVPWLAWGRGAAAGRTGVPGELPDVAPTLALFLGILPPRHSLGHPLADLVTLPSQEMAAALRATKEQQSILHEVVPEPPAARSPSLGGLGLALLFWGSLGWLLWRVAGTPEGRPRWRLDFLLGWAFPVLYALAYAVTEPTFSFSAVFKRGPWIAYMTAYGLIVALLAVALQTLIARRVPGSSPRRIGAASLAATTLPWFVCAGLHGSVWAGPQLGEPHLSFGLLLGSFVGALGCFVYAAAALWRAARASRVTPA